MLCRDETLAEFNKAIAFLRINSLYLLSAGSSRDSVRSLIITLLILPCLTISLAAYKDSNQEVFVWLLLTTPVSRAG